MKFITLRNGMQAKVDDDQFASLNQFKWYAAICRGRCYAVRRKQVNFRRVFIWMHKEVFGETGTMVDHIDNDSLNNQRLNLRACNRMQNGQNRKVQAHSSKFKGVVFFPPSKKWQASIKVNSKKRHLGLFSDERDAATAYDLAATEYFGIFARTNQEMGLL